MFKLKTHLEAIQSHKQSENIIGALKDPEDSQISHYPFHP